MVDITITPANVVAGSDSVKEQGVAGATILAGQAVYRDSVSRKLLLADDNAVAADPRVPVGIALHGASDNQPLTFQKGGEITIGGTTVSGIIYCLSDTAGGICPSADLVAGEFVTVLGVGLGSNKIKMHLGGPLVSGVAI